MFRPKDAAVVDASGAFSGLSKRISPEKMRAVYGKCLLLWNSVFGGLPNLGYQA